MQLTQIGVLVHEAFAFRSDFLAFGCNSAFRLPVGSHVHIFAVFSTIFSAESVFSICVLEEFVTPRTGSRHSGGDVHA